MQTQGMAFTSIFRPDLFAGSVGIVTGGGSGIGMQIAAELASLGAAVVIASRDEEKLTKAAKEINSGLTGGQGHVYTHRCNIRSEEDIQALMANTIQERGKLNFLVNLCGVK